MNMALLRPIYIGAFFFNDTATTEIYTLSLHDALPIFAVPHHVLGDRRGVAHHAPEHARAPQAEVSAEDRKSTRLNSSHSQISYAVFCLKKKKTRHRIYDLFATRSSPTDQQLVDC